MTNELFNLIVTVWPMITKVIIVMIVGVQFIRKTDYEMHIIDRLKYIGLWIIFLYMFYETSGVLLVLFKRLYVLGWFN